MLKYNLADNVSWGFGSMFLYEGFDMTDAEQREAARQFINSWRKGGGEKQDCHMYWMQLLQDVLGVENVMKYVLFEKPVKLPEGDGKVHTRYIDAYIPDVKVLIEQKGSTHKLDEKEYQSGGEQLTPYEQAKRYNDNLPLSEKARWIVTSNFLEIWIYDMEATVPEPTKLSLPELQNKYTLLDFLIKKDMKQLSHEMEVSIQAGDIVGLLYSAFLKQYGISDTIPKKETEEEKAKREHKLRSLNALCVRLVFCLYAEDAGIFGRHGMFHDYLAGYSVKDSRRALIELFRVLDTPIAERDEYLEAELAQFPYVNGGLFADESIEIPQFNAEIRALILERASEGFDWKDISPTIFGAVFESTLNPETRRAGGMHYTSIENIHKVIDPLFLDDLKAEFQDICKIAQPKTKRNKLDAFQHKLATIVCLDPAAGSGNFLTETYLSLRRLENQVLKERLDGQMTLGDEELNPIQVSIQQFYGIEINDFAVTVAKTALWIAESQMLEETKSIVYGFNQDFLPLKTYVNITKGNALRIDWNEVVPKEKLKYIMGNPPFVGTNYMSDAQRVDMDNIWGQKRGKLDYVSCWYMKAADFISETEIQVAFVSTNSICQGEQATSLWKEILVKKECLINFAFRTFRWDSEASEKANVHVVIVGFSKAERKKKWIYDGDNKHLANTINQYLLDAPVIIVEEASSPLCDVPAIVRGSQATDNGFYLFTENEKNELLKNEPKAKGYIKQFMMGREFINNIKRYCLWMPDISPKELRSMPLVLKRVEEVKQFRLASKNVQTKKSAEVPWRFGQYRIPSKEYIAFAKVSSQRRRYVPFGFMTDDVSPGDKLFTIPDASLFHFGVINSNVHMAWMRTVCGRMKSDYSYSTTIVYNTFPWPSPTDAQKQKIEETAQGILDARALYPDSSLADLYDPLTMPPELRKAHTKNDIAVMQAYGFSTKMSEADCVAALMKMYQELVKKLEL